MEGFNPDQSLIPSVGGSITAMSGGGQMGGEILDQNGTADSYAIIGMNEAQFTKHLPVLKQIAKPVLDSSYIYNEQRSNTNEDLKTAILTNIFAYMEDMDILVESDKENAISDSNIMQIITEVAAKQTDLKNFQFTMNDTGLTIVIGDRDIFPSEAPAAAPGPPAPGPPAPSPSGPTPPLITPPPGPSTDGYSTVEDAAKAATEEALAVQTATEAALATQKPK